MKHQRLSKPPSMSMDIPHAMIGSLVLFGGVFGSATTAKSKQNMGLAWNICGYIDKILYQTLKILGSEHKNLLTRKKT